MGLLVLSQAGNQVADFSDLGAQVWSCAWSQRSEHQVRCVCVRVCARVRVRVCAHEATLVSTRCTLCVCVCVRACLDLM